MDKGEKSISWRAPEFRYQPKDASWYWMSIGITGILFLIALWQGNLLFGIFILLAETMVLFWAKEYPRDLQFSIDEHGLHLDKIKSYAYEDLSGFHLHEGSDGVGEVIVKTKNKLHPYVRILLLNDDMPTVREAFKNHIEEIEYEEPLSENIARIIGF
jgi:hypothetical protein